MENATSIATFLLYWILCWICWLGMNDTFHRIVLRSRVMLACCSELVASGVDSMLDLAQSLDFCRESRLLTKSPRWSFNIRCVRSVDIFSLAAIFREFKFGYCPIRALTLSIISLVVAVHLWPPPWRFAVLPVSLLRFMVRCKKHFVYLKMLELPYNFGCWYESVGGSMKWKVHEEWIRQWWIQAEF